MKTIERIIVYGALAILLFVSAFQALQIQFNSHKADTAIKKSDFVAEGMLKALSGNRAWIEYSFELDKRVHELESK